jgi:hypothetical protein
MYVCEHPPSIAAASSASDAEYTLRVFKFDILFCTRHGIGRLVANAAMLGT